MAGIVSLVFLVLTLTLYLTLPELNNLHGKIISANLCYVFTTTSLLIVLYNVEPDSDDSINIEEFFLRLVGLVNSVFSTIL
jgi:hypothetical protein